MEQRSDEESALRNLEKDFLVEESATTKLGGGNPWAVVKEGTEQGAWSQVSSKIVWGDTDEQPSPLVENDKCKKDKCTFGGTAAGLRVDL